jgi:hypothetical protein
MISLLLISSRFSEEYEVEGTAGGGHTHYSDLIELA